VDPLQRVEGTRDDRSHARFLVLYFMRAAVMVLCSMFLSAVVLASVVCVDAFPEKPQMRGSFGVVNFVSFVLMYVYDLILGLAITAGIRKRLLGVIERC
jgi:hypothetical protein